MLFHSLSISTIIFGLILVGVGRRHHKRLLITIVSRLIVCRRLLLGRDLAVSIEVVVHRHTILVAIRSLRLRITIVVVVWGCIRERLCKRDS